MRILLRTGMLLWLICVAASRGDEPSSGPSPQQLIEQLGSEDFRVREAAGKSLQARGTEALPALRQAQNHPDLEIRRRVADLLPVMEKAAALAPTRLNLDLTDRPIRDAVADISRQTGYQIILDRSAKQDNRPRSFHLRGATFWEALEKICTIGRLRYEYRLDPEKAVFLTSGQPSPSALNGPFRVTALGSHYQRQKQEKYLDATLVIAAEPKLGLLEVHYPIVSRAETDQKQSLLLSPRPRETPDTFPAYGCGNPRSFTPLGTFLKAPSEKARTLKSLQGSIPVLLLSHQYPHITINNILDVKNKTFKAEKTLWHIEEVAEMPHSKARRYRVKMFLRDEREKSNRDTDFSWAASLLTRVELQDAKGRPYRVVSSPWQEKTMPASCQGTLTFYTDEGSEIGPPARLIYYRWETVRHRVDFAFHDLRLP